MPQTFEELVGRDLDSLFTGALFLSAGHGVPAEDLLLGTLRNAFHSYRTSKVPSAGAQRWLEGCLAKRALVATEALQHEGGTATERWFQSVASVPVPARVALWLVLLRRWSYNEAAECLEVDRAELMSLLDGHRAQLANVIMQPRRMTGNG